MARIQKIELERFKAITIKNEKISLTTIPELGEGEIYLAIC